MLEFAQIGELKINYIQLVCNTCLQEFVARLDRLLDEMAEIQARGDTVSLTSASVLVSAHLASILNKT